MSPLAGQVAEALFQVPIPSSAGTLHLDLRDIEALAPQVAAAIEATLAACAREEGMLLAENVYWHTQTIYDAALAALRGQP